MATQTTRPRVGQQLHRTLKEIRAERCSHFAAEPTVTTEARQLRGFWEYRTSYRCPDCGARFVETHRQPAARGGDAVV
jgi:hypothetical protein